MPRQSRWLTGLLLVLLALVPRLYRLDAQSLWLDEGSTWELIQRDWSTTFLSLFDPNTAYPLYHLLLKGWVWLVGDSVWALRFPSVLAGAGAVGLLYAVGLELQKLMRRDGDEAVIPSVLLLISPFALWYAQEAKVYSLLLLWSTLFLWSTLQVIQDPQWQTWLRYGMVLLTLVCVHRLAILLGVASCGALLMALPPQPQSDQRGRFVRWPRFTRWLLFAALSIAMVWVIVLGLRDERMVTHMPAPDPVLALWLTFLRFGLDRGPGEVVWWWVIPWIVLMGWGGMAVVRDSWRGHSAARVLLWLFCFPLALFLVQLHFTGLYEARYLMGCYPIWLLVLTYPMLCSPTPRLQLRQWFWAWWPMMHRMVWIGMAGLTSMLVLVQPRLGIFSGDAVKEQYREAFTLLARQLHPDDAIILHPAALQALYHYYLPRLTADPFPWPIAFDEFKQGREWFSRREWDVARDRLLAGRSRSFLVIAPEHARMVDAPNPAYQDEYGVVGLYYEYSREQKKWPCGIWRFNGVHVFCQESPETYVRGEVLRPSVPMSATFGANLRFIGYTLKATTPQGVGTYRAGGVIPISLFWEVRQPLGQTYHMFLHVCRACDRPPVANHDGPPLAGYLPTTSWLPGKPARDDRAIPLPPTLPPGTYVLLMGVYAPDDPSPTARLPLDAPTSQTLSHQRLVLTAIQVVAR